ncbi:HAMP domain-containing histidine kinase [Candidatus Microgenomates bacterium]|nr:HAMP domain-containing histidine kinase [Candidatus Microgenomates bacterium]
MLQTGFEKIYSATLSFLYPLSLKETYKEVIHQAMKISGAKYGSIFIPEGDGFKRIYTSSPILYKIIPRKNGSTAKVFRGGNFSIINLRSLEQFHPQLRALGVGNDLSIALVYNELKIGVLSLMSFKDKIFGKEELELIKLFQPLATLAIHKAILTEELKKSIENQDFFISLAAHELKTPLTSIILYSQLIEDSTLKGKLPKLEYIKTLLGEEKRLTKLIGELLQVHQIRTGKLRFDFSKCDLKEVIKSSLVSNQKTFTNHVVKFYDRLDKKNAWVLGDSDKLTQVIVNLINNSVKFSPHGTKIISTLKFHDGYFIFSVKDQGQGIPSEDLPNIFDKFYQGAHGRQKTGMGLGLYLSKYIIHEHKGKIEIQSEFGKGTTATIKLPQYGLHRSLKKSQR